MKTIIVTETEWQLDGTWVQSRDKGFGLDSDARDCGGITDHQARMPKPAHSDES